MPGKYLGAAADHDCDFKHMNQATLERGNFTILLPHADQIFPSINSLACSIQGELGHVAGVNVYLSPSNSQGFLMHKDGHDLLVVQTYGSKKWEVCVPKNNKNMLSVQGKHYFEEWIPAVEEYECNVYMLTTGDVLYLPRGTLHRPETTKDMGSMHLSIGLDVRGFRWVDIVVAHLRESVLLERLSTRIEEEKRRHEKGESGEEGEEGGEGGEERKIQMMDIAFVHPVSGEWEWHTLFGAMTRMLPEMDSELGMLTRRALPMHLLQGWFRYSRLRSLSFFSPLLSLSR